MQPRGRWWVGRRDADPERRAYEITSPVSVTTPLFTSYFTLSCSLFWIRGAYLQLLSITVTAEVKHDSRISKVKRASRQ